MVYLTNARLHSTSGTALTTCDNITVCMWIRIDSLTNGPLWPAIYGISDGSDISPFGNPSKFTGMRWNWNTGLGQTDQLQLYCGDGTNNWYNPVISSPAADTWYFIACTIATGTGQIVINTYNRTEAASSLTNPTSTTKNFTVWSVVYEGIFVHVKNATTFHGAGTKNYDVVGFRAWNRVLSSAELLAESYSIYPSHSASLALVYPGVQGDDVRSGFVGRSSIAYTNASSTSVSLSSDLPDGVSLFSCGPDEQSCRFINRASSAITLPKPTLAFAGKRKEQGTSAVTSPKPTVAFAGQKEAYGTSSSTLHKPTVAFAGQKKEQGSSSSTSPKPTLSFVGQKKEQGSTASTLPKPTLSLVGQRKEQGASAATLPKPTAVVAGQKKEQGTVASTAPKPTLTLVGQKKEQGAFVLTAPIPTASAAGAAKTQGTSSVTAPKPTLALVGQKKEQGSTASTLPKPTAAISGARREQGSYAVTSPTPTLSLVGQKKEQGSSSITIIVPTVAFVGLDKTVGTVAALLPKPIVALVGQKKEQGTTSSTLPKPTVALSGARREQGAYASNSPAPTTVLAGQKKEQGATAITLVVPTASFVGLAKTAGTIAALLPKPTSAMSGQKEGHGSLTIASLLPVVAVDGDDMHQGIIDIDILLATMSALGAAGLRTGTIATVIPPPLVSAVGYVSSTGQLPAHSPLPWMSANGTRSRDARGRILLRKRRSFAG